MLQRPRLTGPLFYKHMKSHSAHWNRIFRETADEKMGWYESDPAETLRLLAQVSGWQNAPVFLPGAGTSLLIDTLLDAGVRLVLNDISGEALDRVKARLGERAADICWLCGDMAQPLGDVPPIDLWIDRAAGNEPATPLLQTPFNEQQARFSPDGDWLAYASDDSRRAEVYVQKVIWPGEGSNDPPVLAQDLGRHRVSDNGGLHPTWGKFDGAPCLFFVTAD